MQNTISLSEISEASVYCGTYAKYNNGDLAGKWLKFSDYNDSEEFMTACKELHDDETNPEFMFQDCENLPKSLYSESMSESEIDTIYEFIEIAEKLDGYDDSDWINLHNEYCINAGYDDDEIQVFDEEFFDTYFSGKPMEAARACVFGDVNWSHEYVKFNGYGNLETFRYPDSHIDKDAIMTHILENPSDYSI